MLPIMLISFLVLLIIGVPMSFAMGMSATLALVWQGQVPLILLPQRFFSSLDSFPLLAIPLFIFAGELMNVGGITNRLVAFSRALIGHIQGGLAQVNILASVFFAGISGSAAADTAAIGSVLIPAMVKQGYTKEFSVVVTASSSIIGPIIPPSILMVLYGSITGLSIGAMFLAGFTPGLLTALGLMVLTHRLAPNHGGKRLPKSDFRTLMQTFRETIPALLMPIMIVGGILSGVFTATEAGAAAVAYGFIFALYNRTATLQEFYEIVRQSAKATSSVLIIMGGAALFGWILAREQAAQQVIDWLLQFSANPQLVLFFIILFLLGLGLFMETIAGLILVTPILAPVASYLGIDPIHFAIITIVALLIGAITPPVAILVLLACRIAKTEFEATIPLLVPYVGILVVVLFIIAYVPQITLFLPNLFFN
jgi:C4-dicarboxylate transporter DctM subunit